MSDYVKATNFTAKDSLPSGNSGKIIKGTEIDTEFTAVASAVSSKADINSPAFTGTPVGPTASVGTNTTQIATTAFVIAERTNTSTLTNKTLTSPVVNTPTISGGTITGITDLAVSDGGTGTSTLTANAVLIGNGTSAVTAVAPGTSGNVLKSNGTAWTASPLKGLGLDGETWQLVTGSRALLTTYNNVTGKPISVFVTCSVAQGNNDRITAIVGGVTIGSQQGYSPSGDLRLSLTFIVPSGTTYSVTSTSSTLHTWSELY